MFSLCLDTFFFFFSLGYKEQVAHIPAGLAAKFAYFNKDTLNRIPITFADLWLLALTSIITQLFDSYPTKPSYSRHHNKNHGQQTFIFMSTSEKTSKSQKKKKTFPNVLEIYCIPDLSSLYNNSFRVPSPLLLNATLSTF